MWAWTGELDLLAVFAQHPNRVLKPYGPCKEARRGNLPSFANVEELMADVKAED